MNRRSFLRGTTALAGVAIVAACAVNTTNGTTTVTVNTATALAYVSIRLFTWHSWAILMDPTMHLSLG